MESVGTYRVLHDTGVRHALGVLGESRVVLEVGGAVDAAMSVHLLEDGVDKVGVGAARGTAFLESILDGRGRSRSSDRQGREHGHQGTGAEDVGEHLG
jgi:hypothetical protein